MKKILIYDCFSGISGDMNLGGLIDLGVPKDYLFRELSKLGLDEEFSLDVEEAKKCGIQGTKITVRLAGDERAGVARTLKDIENLILAASLEAEVKRSSCQVFKLLANAESRVHAVPVEKIHFHEVGAVDAIIDIVGAALCIDYLNVDRVICTNVEVGSGFVECAHGTFPIPAPATAEILRDVRCSYGRVKGEATTPTGAAILKAFVDVFSAQTEFTVTDIGYGIGHRDFEIPNVLRVMLGNDGSSGSENTYETEDNIELDCNIDDMAAEAYEPLIDELFELGALDVYITPIIMKKSRPATKISVLFRSDIMGEVLDTVFSSTTSAGVRLRSVKKKMLLKKEVKLATSFGELSVKVRCLPNGTRRWKSEYEDVARLARESKMSFLEMKEKVDAEITLLLKGDK